EGVVGGVYLAEDGQGDPTNIAMALAKGAKLKGATVFEGVVVTAILQNNGRVTGVETNQGPITTDYIVNCAGMWSRDVGLLAGVQVPLHAAEHFYIVTEPMPQLTRNMPTLRVPDECAYYKEDAGKLLLGAFEPVAKPWGGHGIPESFCFDQLPEDIEHFEPILEMALHRLPALAEAGIQTFFNGPESFTADDRYHLGEAPNLRNFFVAAGFNSVGIQSAGGAGIVLAQWMEDGVPPCDLWDVDIRRNQPFQNNQTYLAARVTETLGLLYADHFPYRQYESARGIRRSPIHHLLAQHGACFGEMAGWERANWFLPEKELAQGKKPVYEYSWQRQNWFVYAQQEHQALRENVGIYDMSSFGKIRVDGTDALNFLQLICANDIDVPLGRIVYTQWLNERGGIEADLTVTRLGLNSFLLVTPGATIVRDMAWLHRHLAEDAAVTLIDVTAGEAVICVMGPNARAVLSEVTPQALDNEAFPFGWVREIEIGMGLARAHRVSYVGELGWEIYVSSDQACHVFETLYAVGKKHNARLVGLHVMDSCRLEKGFCHFGHDITDEDHVLEAGLGFAVKVDKTPGRFGPFIGRDAVLAKQQSGLSKRLLMFKLNDPEPLLYHNEPVVRDGEVVGFLSSGSYGHTLGAAVGMGYVPVKEGETLKDLLASSYQIDVADKLFAAEVSLKPFYDPSSKRVRM
ncbi:MAG TPA: FAD-dependent oxidoreductase, partial [Gammaproteobacteria bacterium]|nr:FAD-dependent oxidoreductase [Gammaproteobacteria bacterium]